MRIDPGPRFDSIFESHYVAVFRYCVRRLGQADGEDAAAEVFAIAWRRFAEVPPVEAARAWLLGVAYRVVGNHYRSRKRRARLSDRLVAETPRVTEFEQTINDETELLRMALDSLRATDRELLRLAAWDGLTRSEIASVMAIKENAVDQRLFRARSRLRDRLDLLKKELPRATREASA